MQGIVHFHACTLPLIDDPAGGVVCQELRPVSWVEFDDENIDIKITARDSHPDDDVIIVEIPREEV